MKYLHAAGLGILLGIGPVQAGGGVTAQGAKPVAAAPALPVSWTCPMHPDILESREGACPTCRMKLVPIRLDTIRTCPVHRVVSDAKRTTCPICGRELVQVTVAVSWTCDDSPDIEKLDPGTCPDGTPMTVKYVARPHGNHNPQHGGQFFMAADNWHHLEGVFQRGAMFRLYLYDDYSRPLPASQLAAVKGRVISGVTEFPLAPAGKAGYLQAKIGGAALPARMVVKLSFKDQSPESRFDFTFTRFSKNPERVSVAPVVQGGAAQADNPDEAPARSMAGTPGEMLAALRAQQTELRADIARGLFSEIYLPAFRAKDLAIALDAHLGQIPQGRRDEAAAALAELVRATWILDAVGDIGDGERIARAEMRFGSALAEVETAFRTQP